MKFKYGTFEHDENDIDLVSVNSQRMYSQRNRCVFDRKTLQCRGRLCVSGQSAIKAKIQALEAGYEQDLGDVGLYHDSGAKSAHFLSSVGAINGVRVLRFEFGHEGGGEYATYRTYNIIFQADYLNYEDTIYSFRETMELVGTGGPRWVLVPTFSLIPIPYMVNLFTPLTIRQTGEAIGVQGWPLNPGPAFGQAHWIFEHQEQREIITHSPLQIGVNLKMLYPITWRYEFELNVEADFAYPRQDYPGR
jgi:hypothetical protein